MCVTSDHPYGVMELHAARESLATMLQPLRHSLVLLINRLPSLLIYNEMRCTEMVLEQ